MSNTVRSAIFVIWLASSLPAFAIVGNAPQAVGLVAQSVVTIIGSRGNFCTGALIAPKFVLTAAHCVQPNADYKIVQYDADRRLSLINIRRVQIHPQFTMAAIAQSRATADVALLELSAAIDTRAPIAIGTPTEPIVSGQPYIVSGIGVTQRGDGKSGGVVRAAKLVSTSKPGRLQIRLVDPETNNTRDGLGACTGDSGGPVTEDQNGRMVIVGVVSWSTGPNNAAGCGGLTGVTPLTLYRDWLITTAREWGAGL